MTRSDFAGRLAARAETVGFHIAAAELEQLSAYFRLLSRWNEVINLTALRLDPLTDAAIDRLFVEPMLASRYIEEWPLNWFDIGSGGGSPAIPMKVARPEAHLTLIESRGRKAAFLREVVRELALERAEVLDQRFETVARDADRGSVDLATVRAVRPDASLLAGIAAVLKPTGRLLAFTKPGLSQQFQPGFRLRETLALNEDRSSQLLILQPLS